LSGLSVILEPAAKRLVSFFFLTVLAVFSIILFFSGVFALVAGILLLLFYILIYMYYYNQKSFLIAKPEKIKLNLGQLIPAAALCLAAGYIFYYYTFGSLSSVDSVGVITLMNYRDIVKEYFTSYYMVTAFIASSLLITVIWFTVNINKTRR